MPEKRDYYEVLGLKKGANADDIKAAYKRLAKEFHPDVSKDPQAEAKFKEIQEAYGVLSDDQKRAQYDQFGHAGQGFSGYKGYSGFGSTGPEFDFGDLFSQFGFGGGDMDDLFAQAMGGGGGRSRSRPRTGEHLKVELDLKFNEAVFGTKKEIRIERLEECEACDGSGSAKNSEKITCVQCKGSGVVRHSQRTPFGVFTTCATCGGQGRVIEHPCNACEGAGVLRIKRTIAVTIPAGIDNGQHLRLSGEGNASSSGGSPGDLFVVVFVEPHEIFKRDNADIYCEVPVSFPEAVLGAEVDVPTVEGEVAMQIPPGSASGTVFRLKNKGVADPNSGRRGDEFVKIKVEVPKKPTKRQRELLKEFEAEDELAAKRKGFFDRIMDSFR